MVRREPTKPDRTGQRQWGGGLCHLQEPGRRDKLSGLHLSEDSQDKWRRDPRYRPERSDRSGVWWGCADINAHPRTEADRYASAYTHSSAAHHSAARYGSANGATYCSSTNGHANTRAHFDTDDRLGSDEDAPSYAYLNTAHRSSDPRDPYHNSTNGHSDGHTNIQAHLGANGYTDTQAHLNTDDHRGSDGDASAHANEHQRSNANSPA